MAFLSWKPLNSMPNTKNACVFLLMFVWWFLMTITLSPPPVGCIPTGTKPGILCKNIERQALLTLKAGLVDKAGRLSSWSVDNPNCCHWKGVSCSNHTGHVFKLNLRNPFEEDPDHPEVLSKYIQYRLEGEISSCLLELKYLEYLDLSLNLFNYTKFPAFLGSLEELRYLNLSSSSFSGVVPPSLGNLSRLEYLNLGLNDGLEVGSLQWLTGMSSLTNLNLDWVDLSKAEGADDWLGEFFIKLPNLLELHLRECGLSNLPMSINHHPMNFTSSLSILDLSSNNFSSSLGMPPWLFNLTALVDLQLSGCSFRAPFNIPHEIGRLVALKQLDLSDNDGIGGQLPTSLGNLTNLVTLNLGRNGLEGDIHEFIDGLVTCSSDHPRLETLDLSGNRLVGPLPSSLGHLCKLRKLDLGGNRLEGDIHEFIDGLATCSSDHPHLETLYLSFNKLVGTLPSSLGSLSNLVSLYLESNSFWGSIPTTIGSLTALTSLHLPSNKMNGTIAETIGKLSELAELDLSRNQWRGQILNESHFEKLTKLQSLQFSLTSSTSEEEVFMNVTQDWLPPFRRSLIDLKLDGVKMPSKKFPRWTQTLREIEYLSLEDCGIADSIPTEFWTSCPNIWELDLSNNAISVRTTFINMGRLLPHLVPAAGKLEELYLANNSKAEGVDDWLGEVFIKLPNLFELHLRRCGLSNLPMSIINHHPINFTWSLSILDLSENDFSSSLGMPPWLFNLTALVNLHLSSCSFRGPFNIPHEIGRLVELQQLDLSDNDIGGQLPASLGNLTNLVTLNLRKNKLEGRIPVTLGHLCKLRELNLRFNRLEGRIPVTLGHLCKLRELDLRGNILEGDIHEFIDGLATCSTDHPHLEFMDLYANRFVGTLPSSLGSLSNLVFLALSDNSFWRSIPKTIGSLTALRYLNLSSNKMNGTIAETMGRLPPDLETLDLSDNQYQWREEMLNESHFEKLTKLESLDLSSTSSKEGNLVLNVTQDWLPPFRRSLVYLNLDGVKMTSKKFPRWTQTLRELNYLSLRDCGIADSIPTEFWKSCPNITGLDLSNNAISVRTTFINMGRLLPHLVPVAGKLKELYLANNSFGNNGGGSGIEIPSNIHQLFPSLRYLDLSSNSLSGEIPRSIFRIQSLDSLILRNNVLTGELTHLQWDNLTSLFQIDLSNNRLVGKIPESLAHLPNLGTLLLNDNSLEGEIPAFTDMRVLDLGGNKLSGNIPPTLASHSPDLLLFRLRGNMLSGTIPLEFCLLSNLQTLDLAHNNFTGTIPWCLGNLSKTNAYELDSTITLVVKGREYEYDAEILRLVHLVDLSHNSLSGNIPESLMNLTAMQTLSLSMNQLTGEIPSNIGLLHDLETLDLSQNHLSGPIPSSISDISSLNYLNLSHNDLSGRIPSSRQLQTLVETNSSSYDGNPLLCGDPLPTKCPGDGTPKDHQGEGEEKVGHRKRKFDIEEWGFVLSIVLGFVVGFWGVCGSLVLKPSWRQAYFGYLEGVKDKIIVVVVVNVARLRRKMGISE